MRKFLTRIGIRIKIGIEMENFCWNRHRNRKKIGIVTSLILNEFYGIASGSKNQQNTLPCGELPKRKPVIILA